MVGDGRVLHAAVVVGAGARCAGNEKYRPCDDGPVGCDHDFIPPTAHDITLGRDCPCRCGRTSEHGISIAKND